MKTANNPDTSFVIPVRNNEMQLAHISFQEYKNLKESQVGSEDTSS
jgi:hypothetical protein